jgi:hypothetical protein
MAPRQVAYPVDNYRSGRRTRVRLLSLHTTEGARTMASLAAFLRRIETASYHGGSDDELIGYLVDRRHEAWHLRGGNPMSDGFVFCGFAAWSEREWFRHPVMMENAAWWLASCAGQRDLPLRWLSIREAREAVRDPEHPGGVIDHDDYTDATHDGTHWDCGEGLPKDWLIQRARQIQLLNAVKSAPVRRHLTEDHAMLLRTDPEEIRWVSYFFEPGSLARITLGWGTAGQLHEAKWWLRRRGWQEGRGAERIDLDRWGHSGPQPHHMALSWQVPAAADCLEIAFTAPGQGLHIVGTPR